MDYINKHKFKITWFILKEGEMASVVLEVDEIFGISISGGEERKLNIEAWGPHSPEVCKRDVHDGFSGWLPSDFCLMNASSQADSDLAWKKNHFMDIVRLNSKMMFHILFFLNISFRV